MIRLQWNGLRPGDHVDVHDGDDSGMSLISGTVETVQTPRGGNDLAIRITPEGRASRGTAAPTRRAPAPDRPRLDH